MEFLLNLAVDQDEKTKVDRETREMTTTIQMLGDLERAKAACLRKLSACSSLIVA